MRKNQVEKQHRGTLLVIVGQPIHDNKPGGVQLLEKLMSDSAANKGLSVITTSRETFDVDLVNLDYSRVVVFTQTNGRLSREYNHWAQSLLMRGFEIIEENIFALASRYRPVHPNYSLALMSLDGAYRYSFRSFWSGFRKSKNYLLLPNPGFSEPVLHARPQRSGSTFTFLRVGRPDKIKWSQFEFEFVRKLALSIPSIHFVLRLVQPPSSLKFSSDIPNLTVECLAYQANVQELYFNADCYIHHSAIGETFGNTIAEATKNGLPILYAADFDWDQAPVITFSGPNLLWSSRSKLLKHAVGVFEKLNSMEYSATYSKAVSQLSIDQFIDTILMPNKSREMSMTPEAHELIKYLFRIRLLATPHPSPWTVIRGIILEALRAFKNRWKVDP